MARRGQVLRSTMLRRQLIVAPGVYDALTAKIAEASGFEAIYLGSYAASASSLGLNDVGLLTLTEMASLTRAVTSTVKIPVIVDGENGFGGPLQVGRAVRELEAAGAAAIHIEDVVVPKHLRGIKDSLIPVQEMVQKIRAAKEAISDDALVLIARTDALPQHGLDEAVSRATAYAEAGADMSFIVGLTAEQAEAVARKVPVPLLGLSLSESVSRMNKGFSILIYPSLSLWSAYGAVSRSMAELKASGEVVIPAPAESPLETLPTLLGMDELRAQVERYRVTPL